MKKPRLVKAGSIAAEHNREQARRLEDVVPHGNGNHRRRFNPLPVRITNEDRLNSLRTDLRLLEDEMSCESCPPEVVESLRKQALEVLKQILSLQQYMAKKVPRNVKEKARELLGLTNTPKGKTKAKAKVPKQGNHGHSRAPRAYDGPFKPSSKAPKAPGRPSIAYAPPSNEPGPDKMAFDKPQKPTTPKDRPGYIWEHHDAEGHGYREKKKS